MNSAFADSQLRPDATSSGPLLQRKCGCDGECNDCSRKAPLRRAAVGDADSSGYAPPIVHDVLRSSGRPLDGSTRAAMNSRFGHDFSRVRVHDDARAAASADAVAARAYTVGSHIVFGERPTPALLAHELAHTIQQPSDIGSGPIPVGGADDPLEREADRLSDNAAPRSHTTRRVQRRPKPPEKKKDEKKKPAAIQQAGQPVTPDEKVVMEATVAMAGMKDDPSELATPDGTRFILHDTSADMGTKAIQNATEANRGPLGKGVAAYVPKAAPAAMGRRTLFETKRPTTTEWEKGLDVFRKDTDKQTGEALVDLLVSRRDEHFRTVWNATRPEMRTLALDLAVSGHDLTENQQKIEREGKTEKVKTKEGKTITKHEPGAIEQLAAQRDAKKPAEQLPKIFTTATWTVENICALQALRGFPGLELLQIAIEGQETELTDECAVLAPYFDLRNQRVGSTVSVEMVQPGVTKEGDALGKKDTCNPASPYVVPFSNPPYPKSQYENVVALYLRTALRASTFPTITTHYATDAWMQGHCDPRCFNLTNLYERIAGTLAHPAGSIYGIEPKYGIRSKVKDANVWWDNKFCHSEPPA
jgi:hypothetical protein